jgi:uncharacterized protein (UPF0261 family)
MSKRVAILATLDTKGSEVEYLRDEIRRIGGEALVIDFGVVGAPAIPADVGAGQVAQAGGRSLEDLRKNPNRADASAVMVRGATEIIRAHLNQNKIHSLISLGGTQGTNNAARVMQELPYGFPKLIVSTLASGNVASYVGIKDIAMMPSVGDILGLNPLLRRILSNAAGAAYGMALAYRPAAGETSAAGHKPMIAITNLGVLTQGTMRAIRQFEARGYETIVFHAVGNGGRAMEQMIREGLVAGVFDYGLGDIADAVHGGLRAADADRLTVAATHKIPQVVVPGGIDHLGIQLSEANSVPEKYRFHRYSYHNPMILVPRPKRDEMRAIVAEIAHRLSGAGDETLFMIPVHGVSSYSAKGGALYDEKADAELLEAIRELLPPAVKRLEVNASAEDEAFISAAVAQLTGLIDRKRAAA